LAAKKNITSQMNKFERQSRQPADHDTLPDDIAGELSHITTEVIDVSDAPPIAPRAPLTQDEVRTILVSLMLTMFLAALDQTIVATALPTIGRQFGDVSNLSWVITAYLLASTAVAPVFGTLSDIYGRRAARSSQRKPFHPHGPVLRGGPNMSVLILARGLQGLGGGGIIPVVQTVISAARTARTRQYQAYFRRVGRGQESAAGAGRRVRRTSTLVDDFWINVPLALGAGAAATEDGQDPGVSPQAQGRLARRRAADGVGSGVHVSADRVNRFSGFRHHLAWSARRYARLELRLVRARPTSRLPLPLLGSTVVPAMAAGGCARRHLGLTVNLPLYYGWSIISAPASRAPPLIPLAPISTCGAAIAGPDVARQAAWRSRSSER
jgi:MFS family permease